MHSVYNKSNIYYMYDHKDKINIFIGDKDDLLNFLSKGFVNTRSSNVYNWINKYIDGLIFNTNEIPSNYETDYFELKDILSDYYAFKRYTFYDGYNRIIDVRNLFFEIVKTEYKPKIIHNKRIRQCRTQRRYKGYKSSFQTYHRTQVINEDKEFKEFYKPKYKYVYTYRRNVQGNWKEQSKSRKQWGRNIKDTKSIRKYYTQYDIDLEFLDGEDE